MYATLSQATLGFPGVLQALKTQLACHCLACPVCPNFMGRETTQPCVVPGGEVFVQ